MRGSPSTFFFRYLRRCRTTAPPVNVSVQEKAQATAVRQGARGGGCVCRWLGGAISAEGARERGAKLVSEDRTVTGELLREKVNNSQNDYGPWKGLFCIESGTLLFGGSVQLGQPAREYLHYYGCIGVGHSCPALWVHKSLGPSPTSSSGRKPTRKSLRNPTVRRLQMPTTGGRPDRCRPSWPVLHILPGLAISTAR